MLLIMSSTEGIIFWRVSHICKKTVYTEISSTVFVVGETIQYNSFHTILFKKNTVLVKPFCKKKKFLTILKGDWNQAKLSTTNWNDYNTPLSHVEIPKDNTSKLFLTASHNLLYIHTHILRCINIGYYQHMQKYHQHIKY